MPYPMKVPRKQFTRPEIPLYFRAKCITYQNLIQDECTCSSRDIYAPHFVGTQFQGSQYTPNDDSPANDILTTSHMEHLFIGK